MIAHEERQRMGSGQVSDVCKYCGGNKAEGHDVYDCVAFLKAERDALKVALRDVMQGKQLDYRIAELLAAPDAVVDRSGEHG